MDVKKCTCPFTGADFEAVRSLDTICVVHPLTGEHITMYVNGGHVEVPLSYLKRIQTMTPTQAAEYLSVSRQRVSELAKTGILQEHYVAGNQMFLANDVIEYRRTRKNGRPKKE